MKGAMNLIKELVLQGEIVRLEPLDESHLESLFVAARDERIWPYLSMKVERKEDALDLIKNALEAKRKGTEFPYAIVLKETGEVIGSTRFLDISDTDRHAEIGWTWLHPSVWRTRVNTECKYLLLMYGFEELNFVRIQLKTDERNLRSQAAIERIGATKEGILRKHKLAQKGFIRNTVMYSILDDEWPELKLKLQSKLNHKNLE
jgi:RimJ/RimL family protein N-acetyltransferase